MTRINPATFFWNEFHTAEIGGIGSCIHDHNADVGSKPGIAGGPNTARLEVLEKLEMRRFPSCSIHQTSKYHHCQEGIAIAGHSWALDAKPQIFRFAMEIRNSAIRKATPTIAWKMRNAECLQQKKATFQENKANQSKRNNKQGCLGLLRKECNVLFIKHAVGTRTLQCDFLFASSKAFPHLTCSSCPHLPKTLALLVLSTHVCMAPDPYQHTSYTTTKQS